ncbi:uncharacterized protein TNCT_203451 [Trichonephila clavata]|uniref:Mutator-like transposase domain-containing protein n=1 Tax=Trichonephila clavata TaxID=2740835 RepID=A0A8X6FFQ5_TRICU|nr:uncharacterized protein TNCT_203451 [Trichonephila clavata]
MDAISRRYRKPKGRPSKRRSLCASKIQKRWGKNHIQIDSDSTLCPENSGAMHAENSLIMHIENSISNDGSHSGEKEQYSNASANKFQMFPSPSPSTFCASEKSSYVLMNNDMWSSLLCNIKCDECDMCTLDVECNGAYGFSTKIELKCRNCKKLFNSVFSSPRDDDSKCFEANKKLVEAFLKIGKGHAALELFSMAIGIHAMDKKTFSKYLRAFKMFPASQFLSKLVEISCEEY